MKSVKTDRILESFSVALYVEAETDDAFHRLDEKEQIERGLSHAKDGGELRALADYLKQALDSREEAELAALWRSTHPFYVFEGHDAYRRYFERVRKIVADVLARGELSFLQRELRLRQMRRPPVFGQACQALAKDLNATGEGFGDALETFVRELDTERRAALCAFLDWVRGVPDAAHVLRELANADAGVDLAIWDQPLLDAFAALLQALRDDAP